VWKEGPGSLLPPSTQGSKQSIHPSDSFTHSHTQHTTSFTQHRSHNIVHTTSFTQHRSHNIVHTTSFTYLTRAAHTGGSHASALLLFFWFDRRCPTYLPTALPTFLLCVLVVVVRIHPYQPWNRYTQDWRRETHLQACVDGARSNLVFSTTIQARHVR
jgi:hypothetical protein